MRQKPEIKMIFVDLDGTLLSGVDKISSRTVQAFDRIKAKGIIPVIATGRVAHESDFACRAVGADKYLISVSGLVVYEDYSADKLLYETLMAEDAVDGVLNYLMKEKVFFEAYAGKYAYCQRDKAALIWDCGMDSDYADFYLRGMKTVDSLSAYIREESLNVSKFFASAPDQELIGKIKEDIGRMPGVRAVSSGEHYIDIVPRDGDKRQAVRAIKAAVGLTGDQVLVIGDSENDMEMFDEAKIRVAMGNACPELKEKADYIAPSCQEDGVARILEKLLLDRR